MKDGQYLLVPEVEVDTYWTMNILHQKLDSTAFYMISNPCPITFSSLSGMLTIKILL
jgi:hypothetical protein